MINVFLGDGVREKLLMVLTKRAKALLNSAEPSSTDGFVFYSEFAF